MKVLASIPSVTILGVSPAVSQRKPMRGYVPPKINPEAKQLWHSCFLDEELMVKMERLSALEAWFALLQHFYVLCEEEGIKPVQVKDSSINDAVRRMCMHRRHALRVYLNRAQLFVNTKIVPMGWKHRWRFLPNGNLLLTAEIRLEHDGVPKVRGRVQGRFAKMFWNSFSTAWSYAILPNLKVAVKGITRSRFTLCWQLEIRAPFYIPENIVRARDKKDFLDKEFFNPMVRGIRFDNVKRRIKF